MNMRKERLKILITIAGALLFNSLFWHEKVALNTALYDAFILTSIYFLYPAARQVAEVRWLTLGHLLCLAMIILHNTLLSKIAFAITLGLITGFAEYIHRSAWYAGGSVLLNGIFVPASLFESGSFTKRPTNGNLSVGKYLRFAIIPVILVIVFYFIYSSANGVLARITERITKSVVDFFTNFFDFWSWSRFFFILAGLYLTGWLLLKSKVEYFQKKEAPHNDQLTRVRFRNADRKYDFFESLTSGFLGRFSKGMLALKNLHLVGLISIILLNVLLLVINIIDINYLWLGFNFPEDVNLFEMIHEGTDLLIISILLAIAVLVVFFKGNLNFYSQNKWLKTGAYIWIIQNCILVISVFLRDYYYISQTGLAYKRIGVLFYLVLVLVGLASVAWKIHKKKTIYFLFRVNAWAVVIMLIASTTINWDEFIAAYNINRKDKILMPVDYMVTLSNKAIPILDQNVAVLKEQLAKQQKLGFQPHITEEAMIEQLQNKAFRFLNEHDQYTWLSYNAADAAVTKYLENNKSVSSK